MCGADATHRDAALKNQTMMQHVDCCHTVSASTGLMVNGCHTSALQLTLETVHADGGSQGAGIEEGRIICGVVGTWQDALEHQLGGGL